MIGLLVVVLATGIVVWTGSVVLRDGWSMAGAGTSAASPRPGVVASTPTDPTAPTPGVDESPARLLPPVRSASMSASWRPMSVQKEPAQQAGSATPGTTGKTPVRWDPCRPIRYVVRTDGAPDGGNELVAEAFRTLQKSTGLRFVPDGTTEENPDDARDAFQPQRYGDRWAPVLVAWQTADENPDLASDIAGRAGPLAMSMPGHPSVYVSGTVEFDAQAFARMLADPAQRAQARAIALHELGHLAGLGHVNDPSQIMYPSLDGSVLRFADGDRAGLAELGRGPCAPWL